MNRLLTLLLILLSSILPGRATAAATFTGVMEMLLTMPSGKAEVTYYFGDRAQKMEMFVQLQRVPDPLRTAVITRASRPDEAIIINHDTGSWSPVNLRSAAENATLLDFDSNYRLERLANTTLKGYPCRHIRLTSSTERLELWVAEGLGDFSTFRILQSQNPRLSNTSLSRTLKQAGVEGFPVRIIQSSGGSTNRMELVQVWPKKLPDSEFRVPGGYRKVIMDEAPISQDRKAHLKNLMEKMKKFEQ
ncbi:DUF4412 domain-containing protein [Pelodictyon luteolum]|uniref:DUF4412 domain-containing protein n=1 Tax=Chlorobium luteolum (strain DSM 273 / BCRC 81028 / 2530) TaxID=319225 RepID=Q3B2T1_CHLL3|nr:DUF4412 domain-containing protein [Pelodictyon luteolum]ABB24350.1 conserved hypothetical protein [Pelodictyon luteolum DSM 273]